MGDFIHFIQVFYLSHFPITFVVRNLNSCKSTVFFQKKKPKNLFLLILTIFRRIFRDRLQFTDQRRQNCHLLKAHIRHYDVTLFYATYVKFEKMQKASSVACVLFTRHALSLRPIYLLRYEK